MKVEIEKKEIKYKFHWQSNNSKKTGDYEVNFSKDANGNWRMNTYETYLYEDELRVIINLLKELK